jgi:hypothetical protein
VKRVEETGVDSDMIFGCHCGSLAGTRRLWILGSDIFFSYVI